MNRQPAQLRKRQPLRYAATVSSPSGAGQRLPALAEASAILCEIHAPDRLATDLEWTVNYFAGQTGLPLTAIASRAQAKEPVVTLHLQPEQNFPSHPVWCLVCRLACLCPQARVGILVHAAGAVGPDRAPHSRRA